MATARAWSERQGALDRAFLERLIYLNTMPGTGSPQRVARAFLKIRLAFHGYVVPMRGKRPDAKISIKQRGTAAWKNDPNSYYKIPPTPDEVIDWAWNGVTGIAGIVGERSGIMVLEIDCLEPFLSLLETLDLPHFRTPTATSPSGGYHLYFKYREGLKKSSIKIKNPVFNDPKSPCYAGRDELGSLRVEGALVITPPGQGRWWEPGLSLVGNNSEKKFEAVEMQDALFEFFKRIEEAPDHHSKEVQPGLKPLQHPPTQQDPCCITNLVVLQKGDPRGRLVVLQSIDDFVRDKSSFLIPALVQRLGGNGLRIPCPYHPPDDKMSGAIWFNDSGWYFTCHHEELTLPVSQLCADIQTGYLERCKSGSVNRYQHRIYTQKEGGRFSIKLQGFVWVVLTAADLGLITLPPSGFPANLKGFTKDGQRLMDFIDLWDRGSRYTFNNDVFPLARPFLSSAVFSIPWPNRGETPTVEQVRFRKEIRNAMYRAVEVLHILEKVIPGKKGGSEPALYRVRDQGGDLNEKGKSL